MRVLITGASGSGTSTLGRSVADDIDAVFRDTDDYYWLPTWPPFQTKRHDGERLEMILRDLSAAPHALVSGSIVDWGTELENSFSLVVFLYVPAPIRVERLRRRETSLLGHADSVFLDWAAQYDEGRLPGRSLRKHERWLAARRCPVLRIEGEVALEESTRQVLDVIRRVRISP